MTWKCTGCGTQNPDSFGCTRADCPSRNPAAPTVEKTGVRPGIYRLHWEDGGASVASVGYDSSGRNWFAPTNWISVPSFDWNAVESFECTEEAKPAAPAGLPEVHSLAEVRQWKTPGAWVNARVMQAGREVIMFEILEGTHKGTTRIENLCNEDVSWRRLPPAQTSQEPAAANPSTCDMICLCCGALAPRANEATGTCAKCESEKVATARPAAPASVDVTTKNLQQVLRRELCDDGLLVVRGPASTSDRRLMWQVSEAWPAIEADIRENLARERAKDKARIAELEGQIEKLLVSLESEKVLHIDDFESWVKTKGELRAEVERLKGELARASGYKRLYEAAMAELARVGGKIAAVMAVSDGTAPAPTEKRVPQVENERKERA